MKNLILLIILVFSFSCSTDELEKDGYDKDGNSYNGPIETITHNGVERKYIIYTPQCFGVQSVLGSQQCTQIS